MNRKIILAAAMLLAICFVITGCGKPAESQVIIMTDDEPDSRTETPSVSQTTAPELAEDFSRTPESLDGTAWVLKGETDSDRCLAFFFQDGVTTIVSGSFYFDATYYYEDSVMRTDPEEVGYDGQVNGGEMSLTSFGSPYCTLTRVSIEEATAYAKTVNGEAQTPFDSGNSGNHDQSNAETDNTNPTYDNGQYVYVVAGKEIRLSINVWDYVKIGSVYKRLDWKGLLEHYGYDRPNTFQSQYMSNDNWLRIEVGYMYRDSYNASGFHVSNASAIYVSTWDKDRSSGIGINVWERKPDYSDGYVFSTGQKEPGNIVCLILMAYAAEQLPNDPASDPFAELFGEYKVSGSSGPIEYVIP